MAADYDSKQQPMHNDIFRTSTMNSIGKLEMMLGLKTIHDLDPSFITSGMATKKIDLAIALYDDLPGIVDIAYKYGPLVVNMLPKVIQALKWLW